MPRNRGFGTVLAAMFCVLVVAGNARALSYHVRGLENLPGTYGSWATGINNKGEAVGWSRQSWGVNYPVMWTKDGEVTRIGSLPGANSAARAISDNGVVVGYNGISAFRWTKENGLTVLGNRRALDVNSSGQVAGGPAAKIWNPDGSVTLIDARPGYPESYAYAVNDAGMAAVDFEGSTASRAYAWSLDGGLVSLSDKDSRAEDINSVGQIAGRVEHHAVVWEADHTLRNLPLLTAETISAAWGINDAGSVVGSATAGPSKRPTVWTPDGQEIKLPMADGWTYGEALKISNSGYIAGYCGWLNGTDAYLVAVVWEPIPEPASLVSLVAGVAWLGLRMRRRLVRWAYD